MDGLTDAETHNFMGKIREKTKTVKDLCEALKCITNTWKSYAKSNVDKESEIKKMEADIISIALKLYPHSENSNDKQTILSDLREELLNLEFDNTTKLKCMTKCNTRLENFQLTQHKFNKESCELIELLTEEFEGTNKRHNEYIERLKKRDQKQYDRYVVLQIQVNKLQDEITSNAYTCNVPLLPSDRGYLV